MKFSNFDPIKSHSNKNKHGISFEEAQSLIEKSPKIFTGRYIYWTYDRKLLTDSQLKMEGRASFIFEDGKGGYWNCVYVDVDNDGIRLISVHRLIEVRKGKKFVDVSRELVEGYKIAFDKVASNTNSIQEFWDIWEKRLGFRYKRDADTKKKLKLYTKS